MIRGYVSGNDEKGVSLRASFSPSLRAKRSNPIPRNDENGSPRRGGNTDLLLGEVLRGAVSKGAEVKTIVLNDLNNYPVPALRCLSGER